MAAIADNAIQENLYVSSLSFGKNERLQNKFVTLGVSSMTWNTDSLVLFCWYFNLLLVFIPMFAQLFHDPFNYL